MAGRKKSKQRMAEQGTARWAGSPFFWLLIVLSVATLGIGVWQWQADRQALARESQPARPVNDAVEAPDFTLQAVDGSNVRLSDLWGQIVLLNFWATWCSPCRAEMPDLNSLHQEYGSKHDFTVVGVNLEESQETVQRFAQELDIAFPLLLDANGEVTTNQYGFRSLPASLIIDREGRVRDKWLGRIPRAAILARLEQVW